MANARESAFRRGYDSIKNINLAEVYLQHSSFFDFALALILFTAIARTVFMKKFPGRAGKAITIAIGAILAFGLVIAEHLRNFNLATVFSPLALAGTLVLVGFALFTLLQAMHIPSIVAGSATYALIYLSFIGLAPEYIEFLRDKIPEIEVVIFLGFITSIAILCIGGYRAISKHLPKRKEGTHTDKIEKDAIKHVKKEVKQERKLERSVKREEHKGTKDTQKLINELSLLSSVVKNPENKDKAKKILKKIRYNDEHLHKELKKIKEKHDKVKSLDIAEYNELSQRFQGSKLEEQRELLHAELEAEQRKLKIEDRIEGIEREIFKALADFDDHIRLSLYHYNAGETDISITTILHAKNILKQLQQQLDKLKKLDGDLDKLSKYQLKKEMEQAKTVIKKAA